MDYELLEKEALAKVAEHTAELESIALYNTEKVITAFRNNQVQLAWFGGLSGVQARRLVPGSEAIAQGFEDQFFKSYLIAHYSVDIKRSKNFPTLDHYTFTFGSKGSTSGRLMPQFFIEKMQGNQLNKFLSELGSPVIIVAPLAKSKPVFIK